MLFYQWKAYILSFSHETDTVIGFQKKIILGHNVFLVISSGHKYGTCDN